MICWGFFILFIFPMVCYFSKCQTFKTLLLSEELPFRERSLLFYLFVDLLYVSEKGGQFNDLNSFRTLFPVMYPANDYINARWVMKVGFE